MKVGVAAYKGAVANRIDFSDSIKVYRIQEEKPLLERELKLPKTNPLSDVNTVLSSGIDVLICGAINGFFYRMLAGNGVKVLPWVLGDVDSVLKSYVDGRLQPSLPIPRGFGMGPPTRFCGRGRWRRGRGFGGGKDF